MNDAILNTQSAVTELDEKARKIEEELKETNSAKDEASQVLGLHKVTKDALENAKLRIDMLNVLKNSEVAKQSDIDTNEALLNNYLKELEEQKRKYTAYDSEKYVIAAVLGLVNDVEVTANNLLGIQNSEVTEVQAPEVEPKEEVVEHDLSLETDSFDTKDDTASPVVEDANNMDAIFGPIFNETKEEPKVEAPASTTEVENKTKKESPVASGPAVFDDLSALLNSEDTSAKVEEPAVAVADNHVEKPKVEDNSNPFTMLDDLYSSNSNPFEGYNDLVNDNSNEVVSIESATPEVEKKKRGFKVVSSTPVNVVYGNGSKAMEESGPTRKLAA
ncbi:unknown [Coprobacillus sp. CAG:605]|nr:unknown [Coprobacillus sp. CAG:605]